MIAAAAIAALSVGISVLGRISVSYPVAGSAVAAGFGGLALLLIAYRLINPPGGDGVDREIGGDAGAPTAPRPLSRLANRPHLALRGWRRR